MSRHLLHRITCFLQESGLPPTLFGRLAAGDPRLVSDLKNGRECGTPLVSRVEHFMNTWHADNQQEHGRCR